MKNKYHIYITNIIWSQLYVHNTTYRFHIELLHTFFILVFYLECLNLHMTKCQPIAYCITDRTVIYQWKTFHLQYSRSVLSCHIFMNTNLKKKNISHFVYLYYSPGTVIYRYLILALSSS